MNSRCIQLPQQRHRGFTLIEVVLATVILSVILLGMHSAILLASRASPQRDSANSSALRAAQATDQLASDLTYATSINTAAARGIEFVAADRTGDGAPDTIRYTWSGTKGDPLLRSVNGSAGTPVATDVAEFQLLYTRRSQAQPATSTESGEITLSYYDSLSLLNLNNFSVTSSDFVGQSFRPSLPVGATLWRVTRVLFRARSSGSASGDARVQIRALNGSTPTTILDEAPLLESDLGGSYSWREFIFSNVPQRPAGTGLCFVVQGTANPASCDIEYQGLLALASSDLIKTSNGGASWTTPAAQDLAYYVYGTYSTPDPTTYKYWLTGVNCTLRCGNSPRGRVLTTVHVLNEPQVSAP